MSVYKWVECSTHSPLPCGAMKGGRDVDGQDIYVGRANFRNDLIPAKVVPGRRQASVGYDGHEHAVSSYQILCEQRFEWVRSSRGAVPHGAVDGGRTASGEVLYVGRAHIRGHHIVGKIHPSHHCCYVPFDGKEMSFHEYEVLVCH